MFEKKLFLIIIAILIPLVVCADPYASIELGEADNRVGFVNEGNTIWYPVFFSVDGKGLVYIPDFYKGRIAVYSKAGKLVKSVLTDYISPRMNVFLRNSEGQFVVIDSGNLYLISAEGKLDWSYKFPIGFIPDAVYSIEEYIYVLADAGSAGGGKIAYAFSSKQKQLIGMLGKEINGKVVPVIIASEKLIVSDTLANAQLLNGKKLSEGADDIIFLARDLKGTSWWYGKKDAAVYRNLIVSPKFDPAATVLRNHVWLCVSDDGKVYYSGKVDLEEKVIEVFGGE